MGGKKLGSNSNPDTLLGDFKQIQIKESYETSLEDVLVPQFLYLSNIRTILTVLSKASFQNTDFFRDFFAHQKDLPTNPTLAFRENILEGSWSGLKRRQHHHQRR